MGQGGRGDFCSYRRSKLSDNLMDLEGDSSSRASSSSSQAGCIVHYVSKLDTLAGIAIKYGVEVADIKRLNGLTTDLQMFARKSLRIPAPGRHPPSDRAVGHGEHVNLDPQPRLGKYSFSALNGSIQPPPDKSEEKKKMSPAMGLLRGYYGLSMSRSEGEGTEMDVYNADNGYQSEDEPFTPRDDEVRSMSNHTHMAAAEPKLNSFNSMVNMAKNFVVNEVEKAVAVRRRLKGESLAGEDYVTKPEVLGDRVRNTVPRPKSSKVGLEVEVDCPTVRALVYNTGNRQHSGSEASSGSKGLLGGKVVEELIFKLKKSPSTPNLQDEKPLPVHRNGSKGDLSLLSQGQNQSVTIPLLDSFTRRSKAALD